MTSRAAHLPDATLRASQQPTMMSNTLLSGARAMRNVQSSAVGASSERWQAIRQTSRPDGTRGIKWIRICGDWVCDKGDRLIHKPDVTLRDGIAMEPLPPVSHWIQSVVANAWWKAWMGLPRS